MLKISIIIPIYNGEKYLSRCLESILEQKNFNLNDIEIICLNDGGKDNSLNILKNYQKKYPKIFNVINKKNEGIAKTRNKGIKLAKGEYITFIDQDDYYDMDFLQKITAPLKYNRYDVISSGYRRPDLSRKVRQCICPKDTEYSKYIMMAAWAKLHRRQFILDNKIEFFDNKFGEDNVFTVNEIASCKSWKIVEYIGYNWFYNEKSVSNTSQKGLSKQDRLLLLLLLLNLKNIKKNYRYNAMFEYYMLRTGIGYLMFSGRSATPERFATFSNELFVWYKENMPNILKNKYIPFGPKGETLIARLTIIIYIIIYKLKLTKLFARIYCRNI